MDKQALIDSAIHFVENSQHNFITSELAISDEVVGMKIFEAPIFAFGNAEDEKFSELKDPKAIGQHFLLPKEWLPTAKTVISFFLPFTEEVKVGNSRDMNWPSQEWLHGRIEGHALLNKLCLFIKSQVEEDGYNSVVPTLEKYFWSKTKLNGGTQDSDYSKGSLSYTSNWSERHVAHVCGLGTFGLSKGLITKKGIAGRFGSIVTELNLEADIRKYTDIYEYCTFCGACARNCPVNAITIEKGKNHDICSNFLDITSEKYKPRYGCGKCQVKVPCESGIPRRGENEL